MTIILFDVRNNKSKKIAVKTVRVYGYYFTVEYKNGETKDYPYREWDFFVSK